MSVDQNTIRRRGVGLRAINPEKVSPGYTLFSPITGNGEVYLIDLEGNIVHQWNLPYPPGAYGYLLPNGNLLYSGKTRENAENIFWWFKGGAVIEVDPQGNILWEYNHPTHHHDARRLSNGNTLVLALEELPQDLRSKVRGGLPGSELKDGVIYSDVVYEVSPSKEIVWTWHAYEHLNPETHILVTDNDKREEWTHANTVSELADGNFIVSFRNLSTVIIVDRQTGDIIWELGPDVLSHQHYPHEIDNGNILIFDNGTYRSNVALNFSRVLEVDRATKEVVWSYVDNPPHNFYSPYISGAQRLPNDNTLITEGNYGRIFEVTPEREIVWEYVNPFFNKQQITNDPSLAAQGEQNSVFRAFRYEASQIPWLNL
ncbi:aryl-sulfate sulfotransferase [Synechococcus elongatus]|uniref:aryl-sulfate sulfotransferase n=1 Tax=Synechococcus elongatus TaxID=32046 RepID=UPI0030D484C9